MDCFIFGHVRHINVKQEIVFYVKWQLNLQLFRIYTRKIVKHHPVLTMLANKCDTFLGMKLNQYNILIQNSE